MDLPSMNLALGQLAENGGTPAPGKAATPQAHADKEGHLVYVPAHAWETSLELLSTNAFAPDFSKDGKVFRSASTANDSQHTDLETDDNVLFSELVSGDVMKSVSSSTEQISNINEVSELMRTEQFELETNASMGDEAMFGLSETSMDLSCDVTTEDNLTPRKDKDRPQKPSRNNSGIPKSPPKKKRQQTQKQQQNPQGYAQLHRKTLHTQAVSKPVPPTTRKPTPPLTAKITRRRSRNTSTTTPKKTTPTGSRASSPSPGDPQPTVHRHNAKIGQDVKRQQDSPTEKHLPDLFAAMLKDAMEEDHVVTGLPTRSQRRGETDMKPLNDFMQQPSVANFQRVMAQLNDANLSKDKINIIFQALGQRLTGHFVSQQQPPPHPKDSTGRRRGGSSTTPEARMVLPNIHDGKHGSGKAAAYYQKAPRQALPRRTAGHQRRGSHGQIRNDRDRQRKRTISPVTRELQRLAQHTHSSPDITLPSRQRSPVPPTQPVPPPMNKSRSANQIAHRRRRTSVTSQVHSAEH